MTTTVVNVDRLRRNELHHVEARLIQRFSPPLRPEEVQRCLVAYIAMFESARVQTYVTLLIERAATERLRAELRRVEAMGNAMGNGGHATVTPISAGSEPVVHRNAS